MSGMPPQPMLHCCAGGGYNCRVYELRTHGAGDFLQRMDEKRSMAQNVSMITLDILRTEKRAAIVRLGEQHGASNIRAFDSVVRGANCEESDIDFLADFEKGRSLFDLIRF